MILDKEETKKRGYKVFKEEPFPKPEERKNEDKAETDSSSVFVESEKKSEKKSKKNYSEQFNFRDED